MQLDRRQLLVAGSAALAACRGGARADPVDPERDGGDRIAASDEVRDAGAARAEPLDRLLAAHADALPEAAGGANHYPMAAEALEALGREQSIEESWVRGAAGYGGTPGRAAALETPTDRVAALGDLARLGDWLDLYRAELASRPWREVLERWTPRLAPGLSGAAFHGVIRTGHAVRALRRRETDARRGELAVALAYWAARYTQVPSLPPSPSPAFGGGLRSALLALEHPYLEGGEDVPFAEVNARLTAAPLVPAPGPDDPRADPAAELDRIVREAGALLLEMLVQERHRLWVMHTVTGPAACGLLLPEVEPTAARALVRHARQAVLAMAAAYAAPYEPRAHVRPAPAPWPELVERAVASGYVHTIKLTEALSRFDRGDDPLLRSVAEQWLEWE